MVYNSQQEHLLTYTLLNGVSNCPLQCCYTSGPSPPGTSYKQQATHTEKTDNHSMEWCREVLACSKNCRGPEPSENEKAVNPVHLDNGH